MDNLDTDIPPNCPKCSAHGLARRIEIRHDRRTLRYECETCRHEWDITDTDPVPTWNGIPVQGER
jgi:transposase-like protein